jgi:hypothetical protein
VNKEKFEVALRHDSRNLFVIRELLLALRTQDHCKNASCRKTRRILALALKGASRIVKDQKTQQPADPFESAFWYILQRKCLQFATWRVEKPCQR